MAFRNCNRRLIRQLGDADQTTVGARHFERARSIDWCLSAIDWRVRQACVTSIVVEVARQRPAPPVSEWGASVAGTRRGVYQ